MFRIVFSGLSRVPADTLRPIKRLTTPVFRHYGDDTQILIGGGLEKLQGGLKEESYFRNKNYDLIARIREQGSKFKCEDCLGDWAEFDKVLETSVVPTSLRDTCSANKHKNGWEEAFFMNEQNESTQLMKGKLLNQTNFEYENPTTKRMQEIQQQHFDTEDADNENPSK